MYSFNLDFIQTFIFIYREYIYLVGRKLQYFPVNTDFTWRVLCMSKA